jgi:hypothetical protein
VAPSETRLLLNSSILYAAHPDGIDLAVVDITNPAFRVVVTDKEIAALAERHLLELPQQQAAMARPEFQAALEQSWLLRWLRSASGGYLTWLPTYILKLGPENLGAAETSPVDRYIVASFPAFALRIRLQDMARLLADGVDGMLNSRAQRPVCFVNIAGGPASDSWNALITLQTERPGLLEGRDILIAVLDLDETGPAFGGRAIDALRAQGVPLDGLDIAMRHIPYAWSDTERLKEMLKDLRAPEAACAISSEGGLFEYGTDAEVTANLRALHAGTAADAVVAGSVTREGPLIRTSMDAHGIRLYPRTLEAFGTLAAGAGWMVERAIERPMSYHVLLKKQ